MNVLQLPASISKHQPGNFKSVITLILELDASFTTSSSKSRFHPRAAGQQPTCTYYSNVKARLRDRAENNLPWLMDRVIQPWSHIVFFFQKFIFLNVFTFFVRLEDPINHNGLLNWFLGEMKNWWRLFWGIMLSQ